MLENAKWISFDGDVDSSKRYPASEFRKVFSLSADEVSGNRLFITACGLYRATVNGMPVSADILEPGPGEYGKRIDVRVYPLDGLLHTGENELRVTLGDGWYRGCNGIDGTRNLFGTETAVKLSIERKDGTLLLISDESFEASRSGPIRFNDLEQGEVFDARMENISDLKPVRVITPSAGALELSDCAPIREHEHFPGKLIKTPAGEQVLDFGQNLAGYVRFCLNAREGDIIILRHGETLDERGCFTQSNYDPGERNKEGGIPQKIEYICKEGRNEYRPCFSVFGFRYVKVETDIDLSDAIFEAIAVYSEMPRTGYFRCSDERVNRLVENCLWSMKSNFCGIPTDCPTRERAGWTGDAGIFADTGLFLADCGRVYRKWLRDCRFRQSPEGIVENIAPKNAPGGFIQRLIRGSAGWGDAAVTVPMALYRVYGDRTIIEENYDMMKRWVDFCARRARRSKLKNLFRHNPYRHYTVDTGMHFGEWCEPDVDSVAAMKDIFSKGVPALATAWFSLSARLLSEAASILNKEDECKKYGEIAEKAALAWREIATENGIIRSARQADYVRALAFDLLNGDEAAQAAKDLDRIVRENGYKLNTGFLSTPFLCPVLSEYGYTETAYRLLLQNECPSWLYEVEKGATTIWETWDGIRSDGTVHDSLNHYAYGSVCGWLFDGVCGIRWQNGTLTLKPEPDPLFHFAEAVWESPAGRIRSRWEYGDDGNLRFTFSVPAGISATLLLPNGKKEEIPAKNHEQSISLTIGGELRK